MARCVYGLFLAVLVVVPACNTINSTERATPTAHPNVVPDQRVVTDSSLARHARVTGVTQATLPGDMLKVQVTLQNTTSFTQRVIYLFEWYNGAGMLVATHMSVWQSLTLQGRESVTVTGVAPTPQAKDFKLKLKESEHN